MCCNGGRASWAGDDGCLDGVLGMRWEEECEDPERKWRVDPLRRCGLVRSQPNEDIIATCPK